MPVRKPRGVGAGGKVLARKVDEEKITVKEYVMNSLHKLFHNNIPMDSIKDMPYIYMTLGGIVAYAVMIALFVYFIYTSYDAAGSFGFTSSI
jgi:hypothetical protein